MTVIRRMQEEDADSVREVDALSFGAWYGEMTGELVDLPPRTRTNVLSCLRKDPAGCFVAAEDELIIRTEEADFMNLIFREKQDKYFCSLIGFQGLQFFSTRIYLLLDQMGDEMFVGRTDGIRLPEQPQFMQQGHKDFPKDLPE